jgi:hypothetical protein
VQLHHKVGAGVDLAKLLLERLEGLVEIAAVAAEVGGIVMHSDIEIENPLQILLGVATTKVDSLARLAAAQQQQGSG